MALKNTNSFVDFNKKLKARAKDIIDRVESMRGKRVVVGIPDSATYPNGKKVAMVADLISAGIMENGKSTSMGPRPFMTIASEENGAKWNRMLQRGIRRALREKQKPNLRPLMIQIGETMQKDIKKTMLDMDVWDTGRMHSSISILQINDDLIQA